MNDPVLIEERLPRWWQRGSRPFRRRARRVRAARRNRRALEAARPVVRVASFVLLAFVVAALLWAAGEQHRQNCIDAHKVSCSVAPWDNGQAKPKPGGYAPGTRGALSP